MDKYYLKPFSSKKKSMIVANNRKFDYNDWEAFFNRVVFQESKESSKNVGLKWSSISSQNDSMSLKIVESKAYKLIETASDDIIIPDEEKSFFNGLDLSLQVFMSQSGMIRLVDKNGWTAVVPFTNKEGLQYLLFINKKDIANSKMDLNVCRYSDVILNSEEKIGVILPRKI